jgi:hypothetical protein
MLMRLTACMLFLGLLSSTGWAENAPKKHLLIYRTEQGARSTCPDDQIVWASTSSHALYLPSDRHYGHTHGGYACESAARAKGYKGPTAHA